MILACPSCGRRYRLDPDRIAKGGRRVRCSQCGHVFEARGAAAGGNPDTLALVGDEDREFRDLVCRTLQSLGCEVIATADGEEAFRLAVARRPKLMVVNVYLRKLLGVAVCEGIKGSPDLRSTKVALVGSVFKSDRFIRGPGNLYGADDYFEDVIDPGDLRQRLARLLTGQPEGAAARSGAAPGDAPRGEGTAKADPRPKETTGSLDARSEIGRLARIMLSDLKIYYPEEFRAAIASRRFFETFREELTKGKELIVHRFPDLPDRIEILAAALRAGLEGERGGETPPAAGVGP
jgi:predicted Zn finger-like uncharacterized protein